MSEPTQTARIATGSFIAALPRSDWGRVLDVGCGRKPYKPHMKHTEWVGLDVRATGEVQADAHTLPFEDASFDTVLCTDMLHECKAPARVIAECARVLKPGGVFLVCARYMTPVDETVRYPISPLALSEALREAGLPDDVMPGKGIVAGEWADLAHYDKFWGGGDVTGWLDAMDARYPATVAAAVKKQEASE